MGDQTNWLRFSGCWMLVLICPWRAMAWGGQKPSSLSSIQTFSLEEISIQDCPEPARSRLQAGLYARECGNTPLAGMTYPEFKSSKPIYGSVTFDMSLLDPQAGLRYCFAVDESAGTGTGYDRLYFDFDHDSDLTNDAAVAGTKEVPAGARQNAAPPGFEKTVLFETILVPLDYGTQGLWKQTLVPRLMSQGGLHRLSFAAPTARKGKVLLGAEEFELVLAQYGTITGRYDRPMTGVFLTGKNDLVPFVGYWRQVNGTFCKLSPSPAGDKISVEPYAGALGTIELNAGDRGAAALCLEGGYVLSKDSIIDLTTCKGEDGRWTVPVGDYRPFNWFLRCGQRRIVLRPDSPQPGPQTASPAVFPLHVRAGRPCTFALSEKPQVVFKTPEAGQRLKAGDTLNAEAILLLPETGLMIAALDDMTRKTGSVKAPDGKDFDIFESVAPTVKIASSSGQTVAEGKMPFG